MNAIKALWFKVRSNPYFVAFEGAATGAALNWADELVSSGHFDVTKKGFHKLMAVSIAAGITAVKLLYRQAPTVVPTTPPPDPPKPAV